jgi:hypothetical protein
LPKTLTTQQRMEKARLLIRKSRELPIPPALGYRDLAFVAQIKDILRQARDLIKFIQYSPSLTSEIQKEVQEVMDEISQTEKEILHIE